MSGLSLFPTSCSNLTSIPNAIEYMKEALDKHTNRFIKVLRLVQLATAIYVCWPVVLTDAFINGLVSTLKGRVSEGFQTIAYGILRTIQLIAFACLGVPYFIIKALVAPGSLSPCPDELRSSNELRIENERLMQEIVTFSEKLDPIKKLAVDINNEIQTKAIIPKDNVNILIQEIQRLVTPKLTQLSTKQ